jgi:hypothetical protein
LVVVPPWYSAGVTPSPREATRHEADKRRALRLARVAYRQLEGTSKRDDAIHVADWGASLREISEIIGLGTMTIQRIAKGRRP